MSAPAGAELAELRDSLQSELARLARLECTTAPTYRALLTRWLGTEDARDNTIRHATTKFAYLFTNRLRYQQTTDRSKRALPPLPDPIERLPDSDRVDDLLAAIAQEIATGNTGQIGRNYTAPRESPAKSTRGQFYSPRAIVDALVSWAVPETGSRRVLDPAAGPGVFLTSAADQLNHPGDSELIGIDIDPIALRIAALRTAAAADRPPTWLRTHTNSFFQIDPTDLGPVDAVIGNPPYVRAEELNLDRIRTHLAALGPEDETPYLDGDYRLSKRSDAYVYFLTHATRFLRPDGRLAVILPRKWLTSKYGQPFRQFLHHHYDISAIVSIETQLFAGAMIDTCLLLAERQSPPPGRPNTPIRFVRVPTVDAAKAAIAHLASPAAEAVGHRITRPQRRLVTATKPDRYLTAPEPVLDLFESAHFTELSQFASISRGVMTGANQFFFLAADTDRATHIDDRFLRPAVKSIRGTATRSLTPADIDRYLIDLQPYITATTPPDTPTLLANLKRDGYRALAAYIEHAERNEWHTGQTCQRRDLWCNLGDLAPPHAFVPKLLRERRFIIRNTTGAVAGNAIDCLTFRDGLDPDLLTAILNSTLAKVAMELYGRNEAGMLQLMTYETAALPIPDLRGFSTPDKAAIREAATAGSTVATTDQAALDQAILAALDYPLSLERLHELRDTLLDDRVNPDHHTARADD